MQHRVTFPREQRVDVHAGLICNLLEAASLQFVSNKHGALFFRQFVDRQFELIEKQVAGVQRLRSGIVRGQQIFEHQAVAVLICGSRIAEVFRFLLAEEIGDSIARHAKQPTGNVVNRHQQPVRFHQFVEDVLQNVLSVTRVGYAPANEVAQPGLLPLDHFGDPFVPFLGHSLQVHRVHLLQLKTNERRGYRRVAKLLRAIELNIRLYFRTTQAIAAIRGSLIDGIIERMDSPTFLTTITIIFGSITVWKLVPAWLRSKQEFAREKLMLSKPEPQDTAQVKLLKERLENLETLMCRLDSEMNSRLERSFSMLKLAPGLSPPGVSQMPTTFMNVTTALEGRYQVLKELGRGGMGIVFQAYDKQLKEQVAIKILSPLLSNDPEALERLKREVSSARRVTHPSVIRIHDISELNGLHFISMEYFEGTSLKDYIKKTGALSLMQALNIASQLCDGLDAAHRQGVIHRDLKSQNIIIGANNQIKIIDFGLARSGNAEGLTATGLIMGTPEYMAPEQVAGKSVDERADIYSLGIILYEMFTGRVPFTGDSAIAVGFKQLKEDPRKPCEINAQLPPEVESVILQALQKNPLSRFRSVAELKSNLERAMLHPSPLEEQPPSKSQSERVKITQ